MADASHELRTPVTVARTAAQVTLSAATRTEPEYREALDIISLQTDRLTHVVDDMFLLAVADVDGRPLVVRYLYLDELVGECLRAAAVLAEERGVSVYAAGAGRCANRRRRGTAATGDDELARQCDPLLASGGRVAITVSATGESATVTVEDSGPGIPDRRARSDLRAVRAPRRQATAPAAAVSACPSPAGSPNSITDRSVSTTCGM